MTGPNDGTSPKKPVSRLGIASALLFFVPGAAVATVFTCFMLPDLTSKQATVVGIACAVPFLGAPLVGLALGITAVCRRRTSRRWGITGLAANVLSTIFVVLLIVHSGQENEEWVATHTLAEHMYRFKEKEGRWPDSLAELDRPDLVTFRGTNFVYDSSNHVLRWPQPRTAEPDLVHRVTRGRYGSIFYNEGPAIDLKASEEAFRVTTDLPDSTKQDGK